MAGLIIAESAIFTIFVVAYLFYLGKSVTGPTPREVLETPIFYTVCLLSSSVTIHLAAKCLARGITVAFIGFWLLTIALGGLFASEHVAGWSTLPLIAGIAAWTVKMTFEPQSPLLEPERLYRRPLFVLATLAAFVVAVLSALR